MIIGHINLARGWRGGERQTLLLMRGLRELGADSTLIARAGGALAERARADGFETVSICRPFLLHGRALSRFDVVHAHEAHGLQLAAFWKPLNRRPLVATRRVEFTPGAGPLTWFKYAQADRLVAISERVRDVMVAWGAGAGAIDVIYTAIERVDRSAPETVARLRDRFRGRRVVGCVAALSESKDIPALLRAAQRVQATRPDAVFVLLGEGRLRARLERQARDLGLDNVVFEGFQANPYSYYRVFDVFVLTSREEGLGSAILDAFAYGVPVVATAAGGIPELVIPGKTGVLCGPGDDEAIAAGIFRLLDGPAERASLVSGASAHLEARFTVEKMAKEYLALYRGLLHRR